MKKVFLIDDDPIFVFLAEKMITTVNSSVNIEIFSDGEAAMIHLEANKNLVQTLPDIIFLDLNMPVMDGWQFLTYYSSIYPTIGKKIDVYIVSSTITPAEIERSGRYPFVLDLLIKPIDMVQLAKILSNE